MNNKMIKRNGIVAAIALAACAFAPLAHGDASTRLQADGRRVRPPRADAAEPTRSVWEPRAGGPGSDAQRGRIVNSQGATHRDVLPAIAASPIGAGEPWVVWSRFDGVDYDIVWSRWAGQDWTPVAALGPDQSPGDDLDADLAFDAEGRPFAAWWREQDGTGQILVSVFLVSRWSAPMQVSETYTDSRYPTITVVGPGEIEVEFRTPRGIASRTLALTQPATITDDINPNVFPLQAIPIGD